MTHLPPTMSATPRPAALARRTACLLHLLALPVWAAETCGTDPASSPNHSANYILGDVAGAGVAMHWHSGLVWQRCSSGQSGGDCSGGNASIKEWNMYSWGLQPLSFSGQSSWWTPVIGYTPISSTGPLNVNRLSSGEWRLPYLTELQALTEGCANNPKINQSIFPNVPSSNSSTYWSASPGITNSKGHAVSFLDGVESNLFRAVALVARVVRGGLPFAPLDSPATALATATQTVSFGPIALPASAVGTSWGGVRIAGEGNPQFQLNGSGPWLTEAVVSSDDTLTVQLRAGAIGETRSATLTLRSASTTGTASNATNAGAEFSALQETQATFSVLVPDLPTVKQIVIDPDTPTTVYAAVAGKGVFRRLAGGAWAGASIQPGDPDISALAAAGGGRLYAATPGGVWQSSDHGDTWSACDGQPASPQLHAIVADRAQGQLYAGGVWGVFVSHDACASWSAINDGLPN